MGGGCCDKELPHLLPLLAVRFVTICINNTMGPFFWKIDLSELPYISSRVGELISCFSWLGVGKS